MNSRSKSLGTFLLPLFLIAIAPRGHSQSLPEGPAIWREVSGIENLPTSGWDPQFKRPHVPSFRTTSDGRLATNVKGVPFLTLLKPEKIDPSGSNPNSPPLLHQPAGAFTMSWDPGSSQVGYVGGSSAAAAAIYTAGTGRNLVHACLWNDDLPTTMDDGKDYYDIKVMVTTNDPGGAGSNSVQFFVTPITVVVTNPKTENAFISSVTVTSGGSATGGPIYDPTTAAVARTFSGVAFEPMIAGDGRLLVCRIGSQNLKVGDTPPYDERGVDIVYSYYESGATANPTGWVDLLPVSHASHDGRINGSFGFAMYPLLDPQGNAIPDWEDMGGTYPWISRDAKNLFFTTIGETLHLSSNWNLARYQVTNVPGDPNPAYGPEAQGVTRGVAFAGLWSRGKTVLLDNLNNDMDYAIGNEGGFNPGQNNVGPQQRMVTLFSDGGIGDSGQLQLGYGRANFNGGMPTGENLNTTIIDSIENRLNYKHNVAPIAPRDVVWVLQNGKHTDQLAFDDYLDPDALIVASMAGLLRFPSDVSSTQRNYFEYDDGWDPSSQQFGVAPAFPVNLQNAATAHHRWNLPTHGELLHSGAGRLEPAATGGVHGKGLWLDDSVGLSFDVPSQANAPGGLDGDEQPTYISLFVDCRFGDDGTNRLLLRFPDGSRLFLQGRSQVVFDDGVAAVHYANLPAPFTHSDNAFPSPYDFLPEHGWSHLGLLVENRGRQVTLLVNGMRLSRWSHPTDAIFLVQDTASLPAGGALVVGDPGSAYGGASFRGWIDDLKVILRAPDPETAANHANGTLVGVQGSAGATSWVRQFADSFPSWAHDELSLALDSRGEATYASYANFHNHTQDNAVHKGVLPVDVEALAAALHFPEGPLFHDAPRPDTTANQFCISCHNNDELPGLKLAALKIKSNVLAKNDFRRQPSQPPATIGGFIPAGVVNNTSSPAPQSDEDLGSTVKLIDEWQLEERGSSVSSIESVYLLQPTTGEPLIELDPNGTTIVDLGLFGTGAFALGVNLDVAQGALTGSLAYPSSGGPPFALLINLSEGPYLPFRSKANPFNGKRFGGGLHQLKLTAAGTAQKEYDFYVVVGTPRKLDGYQDGFQDGSPKPNWFYAWNDAGPVGSPTSRKTLNWDPAISKYNETGKDWHQVPSELNWGAFDATGGWPGQGISNGVTDERFVMAGYRVLTNGYAAVQALDVSAFNGNTTGIEVLVFHESGGALQLVENVGVVLGGSPVVNHDTVRFQVAAGDILWVALGPNGSSSADHFALDFDLWFNETAW